MKNSIIIFGIFFSLFYSVRAYSSEETLQFRPFGSVTLYRETPKPSHVVLFVSGDGGWNLGVVGMAKELMKMDALVVGIDIRSYLRALGLEPGSCSYPAADFEALSKYVQKSLELPQYIPPVLIGYSSGATLVYATLVQAPPNTFAGAISLGFCPDLMLSKPLCKGNGLQAEPALKNKGYNFLPADNLETSWIVLNGMIDQVCDAAATPQYVKQVNNAKLVLLPKVGHGFGVTQNWLSQFRHAFSDLTTPLIQHQQYQRTINTSPLKDLPIIEVSAIGNHASDSFAVIISGDGGWASIDRQIGNYLAKQGIPIIGFNSLQYFWTQRTPEESAKDLQRVLQHYLSTWHKEEIILIGYSLGADVLPFMANRLSPMLKKKTKLISFLGPDNMAEFEFHLTDWWRNVPSKSAYEVLPEIEKLKGTKMLCFYGKSEEDSLCPRIDSEVATVIALSGGHHFDGNYKSIAEKILQAAK